MHIWIVLITIVIIVAMYFEIYRLKHITVAYKDEDDVCLWKDRWMNISKFEKYVVAKYSKRQNAVTLTRSHLVTAFVLHKT